ncbi:MAG: aspartate/glutamate racemase family protein [Peptococcaceae bacterium]
MSDKILGILGGMGPEATVDFMGKVIMNTPARKDQDHIRMLVDNNPQVPDRTKAISGAGDNPGPVLAGMAKKLEEQGADLLAIPCNTAHFWAEDVKKAVKIPVINMIEETIKVLLADKVTSVVLLATNGTLQTGLYDKMLSQAQINLVLPPAPYQEKVMEVIYAVKSGDYLTARALKAEITGYILENAGKSVILGCTELPLVFKEEKDSQISYYDPTEILAKAVVTYVKSH